ncbi:hypothetical protein HYW75_06400 [Candidatus Pacearchaeota archaeon]|nr:hypothetical protein [Candidatus Pacearchaeota archaeon]
MTKSQFTSDRIRELYFGYKEALGRQPTKAEFEHLYPGAMQAVKRGKYSTEIKTWNQFKNSLGEETIVGNSLSIYTPEKVKRIFLELEEMLHRTPTQDEFDEFCSGALKRIKRGCYDPKIKSWNQFLTGMGEEIARSRWTLSNIVRAYNTLQRELGRQPNMKEFKNKFGGALNAIVEGRYDPEVFSWRDFIRRIGGKHKKGGVKSKYTTPIDIENAYFKVKRSLGRMPKSAEFESEHSNALKMIKNGRYDPTIKTWNQFLMSLGEKSNKK